MTHIQKIKKWVHVSVVWLLVSCNVYLGYELKPGVDTQDKVEQKLGKPAQRWQNADGSSQLAYPRGPMGYRTYMVITGADGKLQKIVNVLDQKYFAQIQSGMSKDQVVRVLGPSNPNWTVYFERRDELVWEWRYCDDWNEAARFNVLFDNSTGLVRSTLSLTESQRGLCGKLSHCSC